MNGRKRVALHAGGQQPARQWVLDESRSGTVRETWERGDGYKVEVYFTRAGAVRAATLTSPGGRHRYVHRGQDGKADLVIDWLADPRAPFGEEVSAS